MPLTRSRIQQAIPHLLWGLAITLFLAVPGPWIEVWSGIDWQSGSEWIVTRPGATNLEVSRSTAVLYEGWRWTDSPGGFGFEGPDRSAIRLSSDTGFPAWVATAKTADNSKIRWLWIATGASGAPMRCAVCSNWVGEDSAGQPVSSVFDAADFGELTFLGVTAQLVVPLRVLWLGFFVNVAFWSLVSAAVAYTISAIRRRLRIAKNLCPDCGYDIRGATSDRCSECGGAIRPAAA